MRKTSNALELVLDEMPLREDEMLTVRPLWAVDAREVGREGGTVVSRAARSW